MVNFQRVFDLGDRLIGKYGGKNISDTEFAINRILGVVANTETLGFFVESFTRVGDPTALHCHSRETNERVMIRYSGSISVDDPVRIGSVHAARFPDGTGEFINDSSDFPWLEQRAEFFLAQAEG